MVRRAIDAFAVQTDLLRKGVQRLRQVQPCGAESRQAAPGGGAGGKSGGTLVEKIRQQAAQRCRPCGIVTGQGLHAGVQGVPPGAGFGQ